MDLFYGDGHLGGEGLRALVACELGEEARLEAAEHLGFCDECLSRYTALLTGTALLSPPRELAKPVVRRLKQTGRHRLFVRRSMAAAAACLALLLFGGGSRLLGALQNSPGAVPPGQAFDGFGMQVREGFSAAADNTFTFLSGLLPAGGEGAADTVGRPAGPAAAPSAPKTLAPPRPPAPPGAAAPVAFRPLSPAERDALHNR